MGGVFAVVFIRVVVAVLVVTCLLAVQGSYKVRVARNLNENFIWTTTISLARDLLGVLYFVKRKMLESSVAIRFTMGPWSPVNEGINELGRLDIGQKL